MVSPPTTYTIMKRQFYDGNSGNGTPGACHLIQGETTTRVSKLGTPMMKPLRGAVLGLPVAYGDHSIVV